MTRTYHPGDWVEVGRQQATLWLASGEAWVPPAARLELLPTDCAVLVRGSGTVPGNLDGIAVEPWNGELTHGYNLIYTIGATLRTDLLQVGFNLLGQWDAVAALHSYKTTAGQLGDPADRAVTKTAIGDLRVPAYDTHLIYIRGNEIGHALIAAWLAEMAREDIPKRDERLAFLRAVFTVKPRLCAAPVSWVGKSHDA